MYHSRFPMLKDFRKALSEEVLLADQLFDSLTTYDPATLAVQPAVASTWKTTPDQQHWDFTISPTAKFSSGRPITATDVKYSLERVSRRGSTATTSFLLEPIVGFAAFNDPKGTANDLAGIKVTAPDTVHFDLDQPLSTLPALLGNPSFAIVSLAGVAVACQPSSHQRGSFRSRSASQRCGKSASSGSG